MEGLDNVNRRLITCCIIFIFLLIQSNFAQEGFTSIQSCADTNFTEPNTTISYISDESWYPDKRSCQEPVWIGHDNQNTNKARIFNSKYDSKWCYDLPTRSGVVYLIRGIFPLSNLQASPPETFFNVTVGVTEIEKVNSARKPYVEGIFKAINNYTNFCLVKGKGDAYLSKLELRPLHPDYLKRDSSSVLKLVERANIGNIGAEIRYASELEVYCSYKTTESEVENVKPYSLLYKEHNLRYPFDPYDRIWRSDLYPDSTANYISSSTANVNITDANSILPPLKVLQTALTHPERLEFRYENLDAETHDYNLHLHFLELNDSVQAGQRVFDVYINNEKRQEVDILASGSRYTAVVSNCITNGVINVTLVKALNSQLGPICNAYEVLQAYPINEGTDMDDENAITKVKNELLTHNQDSEVLETWSGDPCLPLPWHGLSCEGRNGTPVIVQMNLSYNGFTGTVPQFPASSMLTSLDVSHNDLTGNITGSVMQIPHLETFKGMCSAHVSSDSDEGIVIGTTVGGSLLVIIVVGVFLVCLYRSKMRTRRKFEIKGHKMSKNAIYSVASTENVVTKSISIQSFTLRYIETATERYKTLIGEGGFGSVYRGTLPDGQEVAVKVRSATSTQGTREFDNELNFLSKIRHENLVPLIGYCCESDQQILVYPFMSNGSLQDRLYGLTYLHTYSERCVIHRDVKSSNILLDHSMCAKVADFGFSKYAPQEGDSCTSLEVRGTAGYLDPEYYSTQVLTAKSDVFSFGVVLLEIVSGREPLNITRPRNEWSLVEWAKPHIRNSKVEEIVDPTIKGGYHAEAMWRVVEVALACIEPYSAYRPCMADIVRELEDAFIIENNASEYMKSIESFGGSNRYSIERPIVIPPTPILIEASPVLLQPPPPQPR
ncbi:hypothetical protein DH2020_016001 [Rehmannia glutinosa]|uniref:Protein kinase domain-containing protein n=1 Tax=Rehmannia glutinosa TaxID=99300 RepID=A0ABR0WXS1_REHGL